jgi:hypothetical protein
LLRLLTNHHVMETNVFTAEGAWEIYDGLFRNPRIDFIPEPPGLERAWREATRRPHMGPNFWTDAYLAAFATAGGYTIVTFDQGFRQHRAPGLRLLS